MTMTVLTKRNLADLRLNKDIEFTSLVGDDYFAEIAVKHEKDKYKITVKLFQANPQKEIGNMRKSVSSIDALDSMIATIIRSLKEQSHPKAKKTEKRTRGSYSDLAVRIEAIPGIRDPKSYGIRSHGRYWAQSTVDDTVDYATNTICRMYSEYGSLHITEEEQIEFINKEINRIVNQKNKHALNPASRDAIADGINQRWKRVNVIIDFCRYIEPEEDWPDSLVTFAGIKGYTPELVKVLPYHRFIIAVRLLVNACFAGIQSAFAGAGLVLLGMRVGESAAIRINKIEHNVLDSLCRYYVDHQITGKGEITDKLKNEYSYRYVFINGIMWDIIQLRKKQLIDAGMNEDDIENAFLGSDNNDPHKPIKKAKVSAFLKNLLLLSGCKREEIQIMESEARGEKGYDSDHDFAAHLFRRNFASIARNGGIPIEVVDALLGHENKTNRNKDYAGWDDAREITSMINRCFYFGNMMKSGNPSYETIPLANSCYILNGNIQYEFEVATDGYLEFVLTSNESNCPVEIKIQGVSPTDLTINPITDTPADRRNRMIPSRVPSKEEIDEWIHQADDIWAKEYPNLLLLEDTDEEIQ